jgi:hypothetical protein
MTEGISGSGNGLAAEARYLHTCLFRDPLDGRIAERYLAAHGRSLPAIPRHHL